MQSLAMMQAVLENIPQLVFWKSADGFYLGANRHFLEFVGLQSPESLVGKTDAELALAHPVIRYFAEADDQVLMYRIPHSAITRTIQHHNQTLTLLMDKSPLLSETGQLKGLLGVVTVKQPQLSNHIHLNEIIDNLPHLIFWKDIRSVYLGCNRRFASLLNSTPRDIIGKTDFELNWRKEDAELFVSGDLDAMSGNSKINVEETIARADGRLITMLSSKVPMYDEQGVCIGILGLSIDITERKQLEINLKKALETSQAANLVKTEFIADMSHDIRTPITGIIGMSKMLEDNSTTAENKQYAQWLSQSGEQLLTLLNGVLKTISTDSPHEEMDSDWFNLTDCLNSLAKLELPAIQTKQLSLVLVIGQNVPIQLFGDQHKLHRVLLNLIDNAIKFTHNGSIILKVERISEGFLLFQVIDTGAGIPKETQQRIVERFNSPLSSLNNEEQEKIGFHIVQKYLQFIKGKFQLSSIEGEGTTVSLTIPLKKISPQTECLPAMQVKNALLTDLEQPGKPAPVVPLKLESQGSRVLLIEDNLIARKMAETMLGKLGCEYISADNAEAGFELIRSHPIDIVITDLELPGMDGFQFAALIRQWEKEHHQEERLIFALTAHCANEVDKSRANMVNQVLTKPLSMSKLEQILPHIRLHTPLANANASAINELNHFPIFDKEQALSQLGSEKEMLDLLKMLITKELPEDREALQNAFKGHEWQTLERIAHKLKSGAAYCGTQRLYSACESLEKALKDGYNPSSEQLYEQLQQIIVQTEQALTPYVNKL
ncbi:PAS domain-containing hybrid sensor histidine kinase/response regulator [Legionella quinlivanii]|nr:PAS domain-containing hybrid sensor histidine kinase/response regulator [Legionella quinlivanii]